MRILVLSFYYPPDVGPGSLRAKSLVEALKSEDESISIDVMTTRANRYHSIRIDAMEFEAHNNMVIYRFQLPEHHGGLLDQANAFRVFALRVLKNTKGREYDVVLATSSRLFTAVLGGFLAKRKRAKLYLDVRDLFFETMRDIYKKSPLIIILPILRFLEIRTFKSANKINIVSGGFIPYLRKLSIECKVTVYTNGIDMDFVATDFEKNSVNGTRTILYAGNFGQGQGLDKIIPPAAKILGRDFGFILIGDGGKRQELEKEISSKNIQNVELLNPVRREDLMSFYKEADILFLHLNDFDAFKRVLPSKIFEYAATGKPILAGVTGFAEEFLRQNVPGVFIFEPNNVEQMIVSLGNLVKGSKYYDRTNFVEIFMREKIMGKMAREILSL